ncbi:MAG: hypothetical protein FWB83_00780 [Treponema sp.]|nr:hypothetical protein [Treponema sp.]MCL2245328.1 hypothetical protein [Treponema sp.]
MHIELNSRGNGACPFCSISGNCQIQETLRQTLDVFTSEENQMEIVIYSCPRFEEKQ